MPDDGLYTRTRNDHGDYICFVCGRLVLHNKNNRIRVASGVWKHRECYLTKKKGAKRPYWDYSPEDRCRLSMMLSYNFATVEIAQRLGRSPNSIYVHMHRVGLSMRRIEQHWRRWLVTQLQDLEFK